MTKDAQGNSKKHLLVYLAVALTLTLLILTAMLLNSNFALSKGRVTFTEVKERNLNKMTIEAPYGAYVQTFSVVPALSKEKPYQMGGTSSGGHPFTLFQNSETLSNTFPKSGRVEDIDFGAPVMMTKRMPMAAVAALPEDRSILDKCGRYIWLSKTPKGPEDFQAFVDDLNAKFEESKKAK
ncbi:MAG: hypothetical protein P1V97_05950 [Planctomycetota bacterium]|nr:hypothetical protein [Planctomycetota bacterium]